MTNLVLCLVSSTLLTNSSSSPILTHYDTGSVNTYTLVTGKRVVTTVIETLVWQPGSLLPSGTWQPHERGPYTNSEVILSETVYFQIDTNFIPVRTNQNVSRRVLPAPPPLPLR